MLRPQEGSGKEGATWEVPAYTIYFHLPNGQDDPLVQDVARLAHCWTDPLTDRLY